MAGKKSKSEGKGESKGKKVAPTTSTGYPALDTMREEMEQMMHRFFSNAWLGGMPRFPSLSDWPGMGGEMPFASLMNAPKADMSEADGEYELTVELPGLDEKDVEVTLTDRALVLKGEKKSEKETDKKDYHFTERSYGSVRREFALPSDVDRDAMKASFTKGVLTVTLPKTNEAKAMSKRIEVTPS